jgi:hypothetical protein
MENICYGKVFINSRKYCAVIYCTVLYCTVI